MRDRLLVALAALAIPAAAQQPCENLIHLTLPRVTITTALSVSAGKFTPPGQTAAIDAPAFCRVSAVIAPEVRFELWMPVQWNRKLLAVGNGGLAGTINYRQMTEPLERGYATSSTDTGHQGAGNDAAWALGHMQRVIEFAHQSVHAMAEADKAIIEAFYGARPAHAYFSGCSQGGQEALMEAQRYPRDFEGIIAGDPANFWTHNQISHLWMVTVTQGDSYIPASKVPAIASAVNDACDALDGIKDGILNDPRRCHFNPETLLCKSGDAPSCLTAAQVEAVKKIYQGPGEQIYPGLLPGGETGPGGWAQWITGPRPEAGGHAMLGLPFFRYIVFEDPNWDFRTFQFEAPPGFDSDVQFTDDKLASIFNANNPDLSAFRANGGKLIQYHGFSDPDITPLSSIHFYENAAKATSGVDSFYRLFLVPGMQHCGGGPGPAKFDMVTPLEQWVEHGAAPDRVLASHLTATGAVDRTRPLCPYPLEAQWTGTGSTDDAQNFVCAAPKP